MFYSWLAGEGAAPRMPDAEPAGPLVRDNARPSCAAAMDAIGLFNKRPCARSPSVCPSPIFSSALSRHAGLSPCFTPG